MLIRAANPADGDTVLAMRLGFLADIRGVEVSTFSSEFVECSRSYLDDVTARDRIWSWLAEHGGETVGVISVLANDAPPLPEELRSKEGYVVNMWVVPTARRRGIARALLDTAMDAAPSLGMRRLYLHATEDGRPLYEQTGFVPDAKWMGLKLTALEA